MAPTAAPVAAPTVYDVRLTRLGRSSQGPPQPITVTVPARVRPVDHADYIAEAVWREAKKRLLSRAFEVDVLLDPATGRGTVSVEYGRFGSGTVERRDG